MNSIVGWLQIHIHLSPSKRKYQRKGFLIVDNLFQVSQVQTLGKQNYEYGPWKTT